MGKSTISMPIFKGYMSLPEGKHPFSEKIPADACPRGSSPLSRMAMPGMYAANGQPGAQLVEAMAQSK
jgi:hypothetical protein